MNTHLIGRVVLLFAAPAALLSIPCAQAEPLFEEHWDAGSVDLGVWALGKHQCDAAGCGFEKVEALCNAQTVGPPCGGSDAVKDSLAGLADLGDGDYAFFTQGDDVSNHWDQYFYSRDPFARGKNLRCTFVTWWDPNNGSYNPEGSDSGGGGFPPEGAAINGPFHSRPPLLDDEIGGVENQSWRNIEACVAREWNALGNPLDTHRLEQDRSWGNGGGPFDDPPASAPIFNQPYHDAWMAATSKDNALWIRVWLDDTIGAMAEWSTNGVDWTVETESREISIGVGNGWGSELAEVYLGWGTHHGRVYIDDIVLEDDDNNLGPQPTPEPVRGVILEENWDGGSISLADWALGKHPCDAPGCPFTQVEALCNAQTVGPPCGGSDAVKDSLVGLADLGGGDFAIFNQGDDVSNHWDQYFYSRRSFPRGHNMRCTFLTWWDPDNGSYSPEGSDSGGGGFPPEGAAINGPFHSRPPILSGEVGGVENQSWRNIEASVAREWNSMGNPLDTHRLEQDRSWGNGGEPVDDPPASAPIFSEDYQNAWAAASSKAGGIWWRVWLDDTIGAMAEWSTDGVNWTVETDSRELTLGTGNGWGSELADVYLGWGTHHGRVYVDNIVLENDPIGQANAVRRWTLHQ